jgi:tagatose 1,6-diphosphate aldolase GatY/KbaY
MLGNSSKLLKQARQNGTFIPAFNVYNLETIQAAFLAARHCKAPVIIAFGEGYLKYTSFETIVALVKVLDRAHPYPVVLHLDHCKNINHAKAAVDAGFTSVMYDGSQLPLPQNIANMREVVAYARGREVSVEGELGYLNFEDGSGAQEMSVAKYTDPIQAKDFVGQSGVDTLAVAVGNAHGIYVSAPKLDFERLAEIYQTVQIPIVLHGCSGIPKEDIRRAAKIAVAKINVNTEIALAGGQAIRKMLMAKGQTNLRLELLMEAAQQGMVQVMEGFLV